MAHARQEGRFDIISALRGKLKRLVVRGHIDGAELERVINMCVDGLKRVPGDYGAEVCAEGKGVAELVAG